MNKKGSSRNAPLPERDLPRGVTGIWRLLDLDDTPTPRRSLSDRKLPDGLEAPRNSLDIPSCAYEFPRYRNDRYEAGLKQDDIPFGFEIQLAPLSDKPLKELPRSRSTARDGESKRRSPSVVARLMGLDSLPEEMDASKKPSERKQSFLGERPLQELKLSKSMRQDMPRNSFTEDGGDVFFRSNSFRETPKEKEMHEMRKSFQVKPASPSTEQLQLEEVKQRLLANQMQALKKFNEGNKHSVANERDDYATLANARKMLHRSQQCLEAIEILQSNKQYFPGILEAQNLYDLQSKGVNGIKSPGINGKGRGNEVEAKQNLGKDYPRQNHDQQVPSKPAESRCSFDREFLQRPKQTDQRFSSAYDRNGEKREQPQNPTRIVVLKPSPTKRSQAKSGVSSNSPRLQAIVGDARERHRQEVDGKKLDGRSDTVFVKDSYGNAATNSKEIAREIARQMRERITKELATNAYSKQDQSAALNTISMKHKAHLGNSGAENMGYLSSDDGCTRTSRRPRDYQMHSSASLPNSPRLPRSPQGIVTKEGKTHQNSKSGRTSRLEEERVKPVHSKERKFIGGEHILPKLASQGQHAKGFSYSSNEKWDEKLHEGERSTTKVHIDDSKGSFLSLPRSRSVAKIQEDKQSGRRVVDEQQYMPLATEVFENDLFKGKSEKTICSSKKKKETCSSRKAQVATKDDPYACATLRTNCLQKIVENEQDDRPGCLSTTDRCFAMQQDQIDDASTDLSLDVSDVEQIGGMPDIMRKSEQSSPVSILDCPFVEGSPSPVHFDEVASSLEDLRLRLQMLKFDNSEARELSDSSDGLVQRHHDSNLDKNASSCPAYPPVALQSFADKLSQETLVCPDGQQESLAYVKDLLAAAELTTGTWIEWHSPDSAIQPYVFQKLEEKYSTVGNYFPLKITRNKQHQMRVTKGKGYVDATNRRLLFDTVNEILSTKFQHHLCSQVAAKPMPAGYALLKDIWREIRKFSDQGVLGSELSLENLISEDLTNPDTWVSNGEEMKTIGCKLEQVILNSLIEETVFSLMM